jgi:NAD(P)-dependent dehydrogenase (short-subunit alcohol dehydrogenase family)
VREKLGAVEILIQHTSASLGAGLAKTTPDEFERSWRIAVFGAFLCAREAVPDMLKGGAGAIIFTGATSLVRGRGGAVAFSSAKFSVRGLGNRSQSSCGPKAFMSRMSSSMA